MMFLARSPLRYAAALLLAAHALAAGSQALAQPAALPSAAPRANLVAPATATFTLQHVSPAEFERALAQLWGRRAQATENSAQRTATIQLASATTRTTVTINRAAREVSIQSTASKKSWLRLAQAIDVGPARGGEESALVPIARAQPATLQRTIGLLRAAAAKAGEHSIHKRQHIGQFVARLFQPHAAAAARTFQPGAIQQAAFQPEALQPGRFQPDAVPPGAVQPGEFQPGAMPPGVPAGDAPPGAEIDAVVGGGESVADLAGRIGNVKIEIVEGLDIIIVTGKKEDVDRVVRIIEEIERQSIENRPEVEVYYLKHVDGMALNAIIQQVYTSTLGSRLGQVSITPLVKPNALMLVGRKESIPAIVELIQKLDRPVPLNSQIKIFPLKHMSAIDAERTVRQFFVERPGLSTNPRLGLDVQVQVIAEYRANALIVQASPRDMQEVSRLIESLDIEGPGASNEVRVFKLRNSLADELAPVLQEAITGHIAGQQAVPQQQQQQGQGGQGGQTSPAVATPPAISLQFLQIGPEGQKLLESGILANMRITADSRSNTLIVIGPASSMELMAALVQQLDDLPAASAQIKVFTITNGDATALAEMLQNLFGGQQQQQGGQNQPFGGLQTATGAGESTLVPLRFSVDQRTNSIIATGNPGDLDVIFQILTRLDEGDIRKRITTVYTLHNAPAADVALALNNLLQQQRDINQAAPELVSPYEQIEREVIVVEEPVTNSLIVSATPRYYEEIKRVIEELDRRPPMVMIQVLIAEVNLSDIDQFGVEWGLQDSLMFDRSIVGTAAPPGRYNFPNSGLPNDNTPASLATRENVAGQAISNLALGRTSALGFGGLVLAASSESVNVLIRALEQSNRAQVLSRPQIQTLDNQAARVQVGALVPRITGVQSSTVGVANPTVADTPVGIILQVQPRTSPDGTIVMSVYAEKSFVGPEAQGIPIFTDAAGNVIRSPQIPITTAQTIVSAKSGQTIILGGLITKELNENTNRIPYLADMPVFGRLFRFDTVSDERTELLIIMTPYIISTAEQIEWMNARESERMSWCIADVVNIHGPVGMSGNPAFNGMESPLIFPDVTPAGQEPTPAEPQTSQPEGVPAPGQPTWYQPLGQTPFPATPLQPVSPTPPAGQMSALSLRRPLVPPQVQLAAPPAGTGPAGMQPAAMPR